MGTFTNALATGLLGAIAILLAQILEELKRH